MKKLRLFESRNWEKLDIVPEGNFPEITNGEVHWKPKMVIAIQN